MAVTGFWPVCGNLKATLDYAGDPDKTTPKEYLDEDLFAALRYVKNDSKTDRQVFVGGINCSKQNAYAEMVAVQRRFGMHGKVVGYHGIQSFAAGEVTPEEAFEIGKKTARRMWGDRYQVLVTVHLNTDNVHCHFVVNPVSFKDGQKFRNKIGDHKELRKISDDVCREHGLSVLENSEFYSKGKKKEYWLHRQGKKTHRDILKEDVEYCLTYAGNWEQFGDQMRGRGYTIDWKRMSVRAKDWERSVRLTSLGYNIDEMTERLENNLFASDYYFKWNSHLPYKPKQFPLEYQLRRLLFSVEHSYDTATVLVDTLLLILIEIIKIVTQMPDIMLLSPDLHAAEKNFEQYRSDYHFLKENGIRTIPELSDCIADTREQITALEAERSKADNARRRAHSPKEVQDAKDERKAITEKIRPLRTKVKQAERIMEEAPHLYELLQHEHDLEKAELQRIERNR